MSVIKNRTVIGILCIVLSLVICFAVTPLFNKSISKKTEIVRVVKPIKIGDEITKDMVKRVEVGAYNLPKDVVRTVEEVEFLKEQGIVLPLIFDYNLYAYNQEAKAEMLGLGADRLTLPVELNSRELERLGGGGEEMIAYGAIPMMVSAQCIRKTMEGCSGKTELLYLKDRMGKEMPVKNICPFCYNIFYNSAPLSLLGDRELIKRLNPSGIRLQFSTESPGEVQEIAAAFADVWMYGKSAELPVKEYTRGHFKRGVE